MQANNWKHHPSISFLGLKIIFQWRARTKPEASVIRIKKNKCINNISAAAKYTVIANIPIQSISNIFVQ